MIKLLQECQFPMFSTKIFTCICHHDTDWLLNYSTDKNYPQKLTKAAFRWNFCANQLISHCAFQIYVYKKCCTYIHVILDHFIQAMNWRLISCSLIQGPPSLHLPFLNVKLICIWQSSIIGFYLSLSHTRLKSLLTCKQEVFQ